MKNKRYVVTMKIEINDTEMRVPFYSKKIEYKRMSQEEIMNELQSLLARVGQFR